MKGYRHVVTIEIHKDHFRDMMAWLHDAGHEIRSTMVFGQNEHKTGDEFVTQWVHFKNRRQAILFKLKWG